MKIIVAVSGASGAIYAKRLIKRLSDLDIEIALTISKNGIDVWKYELDEAPPIEKFVYYHEKDFNAPFASGSSDYQALVVCPCSMGTLGRIANGVSDSLITRAADVMMKERKKLILVPREMPYNLIHIENMRVLTITGATIIPASPSFYSKPNNITELVDTVIDKILLNLGLNFERYKWGD